MAEHNELTVLPTT